ncbi:hypothetical protein R1flu_007195 [Riccia fluitans]|uniref:Uncharacterized protein n=1 Tax=Riccia fluitans TaxID=41844 RepID=A0ABD1YY50_9MARC
MPGVLVGTDVTPISFCIFTSHACAGVHPGLGGRSKVAGQEGGSKVAGQEGGSKVAGLDVLELPGRLVQPFFLPAPGSYSASTGAFGSRVPVNFGSFRSEMSVSKSDTLGQNSSSSSTRWPLPAC